jgi:hypothetical protein
LAAVSNIKTMSCRYITYPKTYASEKRATDDGEWEHSVILLKPNSTESRFKDIVLHEDDCENMRIVGEFVTVLEK